MVFSILLIVFNSQRFCKKFLILIILFKHINFLKYRARASVIGNIPGTKIFESIDACEEAKEFDNIKIIRYEESLFYANVENFKYKVIKLTKVNPELKRKENSKPIQIKHIIIDCSCMNYIDSQGVNTILQVKLFAIFILSFNILINRLNYKLNDNFKQIVNCKRKSFFKHNYLKNFLKNFLNLESIIKSLKKFNFQEKLGFESIFLTTNDAVYKINNNEVNLAFDEFSRF